jgi:hypothetical protein
MMLFVSKVLFHEFVQKARLLGQDKNGLAAIIVALIMGAVAISVGICFRVSPAWRG